MDNSAARKLIAAPSGQQEPKMRPQSRLLLTEPSGLLYSTLTNGRFAHFPEKIRLDVAMAVARAVDVEMGPDEQVKMVEKCLGNLGKIYEIGGEKAVLAWCRVIRECGCFFGSANMIEVLSEAVKWTWENGNGKGADAYRKNALVCGAEILMEPKVAAVLGRAQEEVGEEVVPTLATAFMAIAARWGIERAAKVAESIRNVDMCNPDFLFSTLEICGSSGTELDALADSLEKNGGLLWAVPGVDKGILETLVMRPGRIMNAILRREGFPADSLLHNAMERRERLGFLSVIADRRALEHPDAVVRGAAIKRLVGIVASQSYADGLRKSAAKALIKNADENEICDEEFLKLKDVLEDEKSPENVREQIGIIFLICCRAHVKVHNNSYYYGGNLTIDRALVAANFIGREDRGIAAKMMDEMPFCGPFIASREQGRRLERCLGMLRLPEMVKTIKAFESKKDGAELAGISTHIAGYIVTGTRGDKNAGETLAKNYARTIGAYAHLPRRAIEMAEWCCSAFKGRLRTVDELIDVMKFFRSPDQITFIEMCAQLKLKQATEAAEPKT